MKFKKLLPLLILACGTAAFFLLGGADKLNIEFLRSQINFLQELVAQNYLKAVLVYMTTYILVTAFSLPLALPLTLTGGFLFGAYIGAFCTVTAATIGATLIFSAARYAIGDWLAQKVEGFLHQLQDGFNENAFSYMLMLRMIPLFPFWVINIVPALLAVRLRVFVASTFIGIIPATFVFSLIGSGLGDVFAGSGDFSPTSVITPKLLMALSGLGLLALLPILYKTWKKRQNSK